METDETVLIAAMEMVDEIMEAEVVADVARHVLMRDDFIDELCAGVSSAVTDTIVMNEDLLREFVKTSVRAEAVSRANRMASRVLRRLGSGDQSVERQHRKSEVAAHYSNW